MTEATNEALNWIWKMLLTFIIAFVAIAMVAMLVKDDVNTIDVQRALMINRVLYSPDGPWLVDEQGMMQPGVFEKSKFTQERINAAFDYPVMYGGARLTIIDKGVPTTLYINKPTFENLRNQALNGITYGGNLETHTYPVLIKDGTDYRNGHLVIEVAMPYTT